MRSPSHCALQDASVSFQHDVMTEQAAPQLLPPSPVPPLLPPQPMVRMPQSPMKPSVFGGYPFGLVDSDVGMIAAWICQRGNDN